MRRDRSAKDSDVQSASAGSLKSWFGARIGSVGDRFAAGGVKPVRRFVGALQQGVAFEFLLDEGGQFQIGELQKLDRLQKLRSHDQGLSLAHHELSAKRHFYVNPARNKQETARFLLIT